MAVKTSVKSVLKSLDFSVDEETLRRFGRETRDFVSELKKKLRKERIDAEVSVGGSFAKETLVEKNVQDIDILVRFSWKIDGISKILEKIVRSVCKKEWKIKTVHGSRDYFEIERPGFVFEVIPVTKIRNPREARNVTDLSYFHVNYVRKKLGDKRLKREIRLAKKFFQAQEIYGAESYINGFSGYALECLIIYYKSLENLLKKLGKIRPKEKTIIDPEKKYKRKADILLELNESKRQGPIVLVDPTWRERNVLSALSWETFEKFQKVALQFLRKPRKEYFEKKDFDFSSYEKKAKKKGAEFLHFVLETNKQEGDIAGTKMKKFSGFLNSELRIGFDILSSDFRYNNGKKADFYLVLKSKKEIVRKGPPVKMKRHALVFRKKNTSVFTKSGVLYARIKAEKNARNFMKTWLSKRQNKNKMKEIGIVGVKVY